MKKCINCHYLIILNQNRDGISEDSLCLEDRKSLNEKISIYRDNCRSWINCYKDVWDIKNHIDLNILKERIFNKNKCFFFSKYQDGIGLNALKEKQSIITQNKINIINFLLAFIAIIVSIIAIIIK